MPTRFKFLIAFITFCAVLVPVLVFAHPEGAPQLFPFGFWGPIVSCGYEGASSPCVSVCDLIHTTQHFIYLGLTLLVFIFAPIAIIGGAFMIMLSGGSEDKVKKGRTVIMNAVIGLAIGLCAFLIINTVLWAMSALGKTESVSWPNIQCGDGNLAPVSDARGINANLPPPKTSGALAGLPAGTLTDDDARTRLALAGIAVNKKNCTFQGQTNCTSFDGIPARVITKLETIKRTCECNIQVTGGTEAGHKTHGIGKAIVDLSYGTKGLNEYIYSQIGTENPIPNRSAYNGKDGVNYLLEDDPLHWHVRF